MAQPEHWVDVARFDVRMEGIEKAPLFAGARAKIARAALHLSEVKRLHEAHLASPWFEHSITAATETEPVIFKLVARPPGFEYSAALGDFIHNLRSALDHMAVSVVDANKGNTKDVQFPFAPSVDKLEESIRKANFHRAHPDAVDLLRAQRPYRGGNQALRGLHDLDVRDKHRSLVPSASMALLESSLHPRAAKTPAEVEFKNPRLRLVFHSKDPFGGQEILPTLHSLLKLVEGVVDAFETLLIPTSP